MKKISINQISDVIDKTIERLKSQNSKHINLLFVGEACIGKSDAINNWFEDHQEYKKYYLTCAPCGHFNENNIFIKDKDLNGKIIYGCVGNNEVDRLNNKKTIAIINLRLPNSIVSSTHLLFIINDSKDLICSGVYLFR